MTQWRITKHSIWAKVFKMSYAEDNSRKYGADPYWMQRDDVPPEEGSDLEDNQQGFDHAGPCPACHTESHIFLGQLGKTFHYRCRDCGYTYYEDANS
jgi:hypothetical protein